MYVFILSLILITTFVNKLRTKNENKRHKSCKAIAARKIEIGKEVYIRALPKVTYVCLTHDSYICRSHIHTQLVITTLQSGLLTKFLTPLMLSVLILYIRGGTYSLNSTPNNRFLRNFWWQLEVAVV